MQTYILLLSFIVFAPAIGAIVLAFFPKDKVEAIRLFTLAVTLIVLVSVVWMAIPREDAGSGFDMGTAAMQDVFKLPWIPSFDIHYFMGFDGISFPLVVLTALVCALAMGASWSVTKYVKAYCMLFLLLETGMLGVFLSLDFFLFYVFWEVMLLPMYFLIGVWGGPRKEYAAIKFFLYTLVGSVLMLIAILMLYFNSDLRRLTVAQLKEAQVISSDAVDSALVGELTDLGFSDDEVAVVTGNEYSGGQLLIALRTAGFAEIAKLHTFNILALQQMGQHTDLFDGELLFGWTLQWWAFVLLFIGFIIKVPSVPLHTWLPDAHVEAPTPISMILAGVLLKMGGYGIIRICYPICPDAGYDLRYVVCAIGLISMVYGAFAAMAQTDLKRLVAYSSVSHMGYVVLGLGVWTATAGSLYNSDSWNMGVKGAMFQMIAHGISSAGMFFMVGVIYDRVHHRNVNEFGGLFGKMPLYTGLSIVIFFAGLGLPGLCGFIGEVFVVLSVWKFSMWMAVVSASVVILTAGYILWAIQRVYLGAEYKGPHEEALVPIKLREIVVAVPLVILAIWFGVFPQTVLSYMDVTIDHQVESLADWKKRDDLNAAFLQVSAVSAEPPGRSRVVAGDESGDAIKPPARGADQYSRTNEVPPPDLQSFVQNASETLEGNSP